jgi:hypothetical protein
MHEYRHVGAWGKEEDEREREQGALTTFLLTTLLPPRPWSATFAS